MGLGALELSCPTLTDGAGSVRVELFVPHLSMGPGALELSCPTLTDGAGSVKSSAVPYLPMGPGALELSCPRLELPKPFCMPRFAVRGGKTLGVTVV